jgi:hypothetical protein
MPNTAELREKRRDARVLSRAGSMPPGWDDLENAQRMVFTQAERAELHDQEFMWAPDAPEHGVLNSYNNYYCRCPKCRSGNARHAYATRKGVPEDQVLDDPALRPED